jgi:Spy/CpxP family protein refolding chaperone
LWFCAITVLGPAARAAFGQERPSPYADEADREIKALGPEEVVGLLDGAGLGFAKAAELNGVPGPRHALELASELTLSDEQRARVQIVYDRMHAEAVELGARVVELERELDRAFAATRLTPEEVERLTIEIGNARGRLRATHLLAHLETAEVLSSEQIARYGYLRGYRWHSGHDKGHQPEDAPR